MSHDRDVKFCECGASLWDGASCNCRELKIKSEQIGGDHYKADYQHWDWAIDVRLGYLESAATKYVFRWYKKNGVEDLKKALSYMIKAKEGYFSGRHFNKCLHNDTYPLSIDKAESLFNKFVEEAEVPMIEADLCILIAQWKTDADLSFLVGQITAHIKALHASGHTGPLLALTAPLAQKTGGIGRAGGTTTQPIPSSASIEPAKINHPSPFGYRGED